MQVQLPDHFEKIIAEFEGDPGVLDSALGAYVFGQFYGWRCLRFLHTDVTLRRYGKVLDISWNELPEFTDLSNRMRGIRVSERLGAFWRLVRGEVDAFPRSQNRLLSTVDSVQGDFDL